jgi:hypothetical protein
MAKVMAAKKAATDQLRDDIDRGRTGEKVNFSDPAAAPLGTDEEAAGTPLDATVVAMVRDRELAKAPDRPKDEAQSSDDSQNPGRGVVPVLAIIAALFAVVAAIWNFSS